MVEVLVCILLIAADILTKLAAVKYIMPAGSIKLIDDFFSLTYVENRGAAFGSMQGGRYFFIIFTIIIVVLIAVYYMRNKKREKNTFLSCSVVLICAGATGNLIDRIIRGYVVDFFDFYIFGYNFPVFNVADICVIAGVALLMIYIFKSDTEE